MSLPIPERESVSTAISLLSPRDRRLYWLAVALQFLLALMDLVGVLLLGGVGALLAATASNTQTAGPVAVLLDRLGWGAVPSTTLAFTLAGAAALLLIVKSALALLIQSRLLRFLGNRAGTTSADLADRFLSLPMLEVRRHPSQVTAYALMDGVSALITGLLGSFMVVVSEAALLTVLGVALLLIDPVTTVVAVLYFGGVAFLVHRRLGAMAQRAGTVIPEANVAARTSVEDAVNTYPEIVVLGRRRTFIERFAQERGRFAAAQARSLAISAAPRYLIESALVLGTTLIAITLILTNDLAGAVGGIVLFLAAASRVVPSMLRLNSATITMRNQSAAAERAEKLAQEIAAAEANLGEHDATPEGQVREADNHAEPGVSAASGDILITDASLTYPGRNAPALSDINLSAPAGCSLALVGPTGSGKSSLAALILGLVEPTAGSVRIGGVRPQELTQAGQIHVGYVPQEVALVAGSVRDNVALGVPAEDIDDDRVWAALRRAHLAEFVSSLPEQLDTLVGERGQRLSGGQRQRIGLARALYEPPLLLVLDEATSALDAETERSIAETIHSLSGHVTTVTVAHRLATIRQADIVAYLHSGQLVAQGTFDQVRATAPDFDRQAQLLGL